MQSVQTKIISIFLLIPSLLSAAILLEDNTKRIESVDGSPSHVLINLKDDGNSIAELSTEITCNVFRLLKECGIPVAFHEQSHSTKFVAPKCDMVHYQVVARREAHDDYVKRNPHIKKGHLFPRLLIEFFLKTTDQKWQNYSLPYDNPYIQFRDNKAFLYNPAQPIWNQTSFLGLNEYPLKGNDQQFMRMIEITARTFLVLEKAWQLAGSAMVDCSMEFGFDCHGNLLLADVLNNNSWHITQDAQPIEKSYRDSTENNAVAKNHRYIRDRTAEFRLPKQQIIIWRGSEKDDVQPFIDHIKPYMGKEISVTMITCPAQKDPITAYRSLLKAVQATPDCVVVIFITMRGNTAGSLIAANTLAPTIAVPLGWQEFPDDIWSSLRNSSEIPLMTILDPANAGLATLQILAKRNPRLYSVLQMQTMSRLQNVVDM